MCKTCTTFSARPSLQNDMDGGVAAALIEEEEAEQRACPDLDAHWRLDEAMDRAEKAERERDEARGALRARLGMSAQPRPLTADDITDEMVERAREEFFGGDVGGPVSGPSSARRWRAALTAALTEPTRPEWADLADVISETTYHPEPDDLARALHHEGVRVVTEEQS